MNADLRPHHTRNANVEAKSKGWRLEIPAGDKRGYRLAQLDDYYHFPRRNFPHHSLTLGLRARTSAGSLPGTWGFGVWNDPFGLSLGFGGSPLRLPALPNAAWFFCASKENYLSFGEKPGNGFLAQTFRSPRFDARLVPAGLAMPFSRRTTRRLLERIVEEDGVCLVVDVTQWHGYRLRWSPKRVVFEVDEDVVMETSVSPYPPLGLVIWIDNQYAAFPPEGGPAFGILPNPAAWLEIEELEFND